MTKRQRIKLLQRWGGGRIDAEEAYAELERLRKSGGLTAERVLEAATDKGNPLHAAFEWDDLEAARQYRLQQARGLIRAVVAADPAGKNEPTRIYVHVPPSRDAGDDARGGHYERADILPKNVDMFVRALEEARAFLRTAQSRVDELTRHAAGDEDRIAIIAMVSQALTTAEAAINRLH